MMGYMFDVPEALFDFLVTSNRIMRNSNKPGKVSVMLLGRVVKLSDYNDAFKSHVRMTIYQSEGRGWEKISLTK